MTAESTSSLDYLCDKAPSCRTAYQNPFKEGEIILDPQTGGAQGNTNTTLVYSEETDPRK